MDIPDSEEYFDFRGKEEGKSLVVLSGIHGDEQSPVFATEKVIKAIEDGIIQIRAGELRFIPVCNREAFEKNVRHTGTDINRCFKRYPNPSNKDEERIEFIAACIEERASKNKDSYVLDLHQTTTSETPYPFVLQDSESDKQREGFTNAIGFPFVLRGVLEAYAQAGVSFSDTQHFSNGLDMKAITVECMKIGHPDGEKYATLAILRAMNHLGLIHFPDLSAMTLRRLGLSEDDLRENQPPKQIWIKDVLSIPETGGSFSKRFDTFERVCKGDVIFTAKSGETVTASDDGYVIMPKFDHIDKPGAELGYLAVDYDPYNQ